MLDTPIIFEITAYHSRKDGMYTRDIAQTLEARILEPRRFMQVVVGARQTGKTTAIKQAVKAAALPTHVATADSPLPLAGQWVETEWVQARQLATERRAAVLVLDEIQKVRGWSEVVKRLRAPSSSRRTMKPMPSR